MLPCPMCPKTFKVRGNLNMHIVTHTNEKPYKCLTCSKAFRHLSHLKGHMKTVHEGVKIKTRTKEKNFKCPMCSYRSNGKSRLGIHLRTHLAEKPYSCSIPGCSFKTIYETSLPQHVKRIHKQERPHECTTKGCNYKTSCTSNLYRHLKVHSNEKPFVCKFPGCKFACKIKSGLDRHNSAFHSNEKPYQCSTCVFRTKYKSTLRIHEDEHKNIRRFPCPIPSCSFASHRSHGLKLHIDCKHRSKDVICTAAGCSFRCGTSALLKKHVKQHTSPILKCPSESCYFSARLPWRLRLHVSSKHKELEATLQSAPGQFNRQTFEQDGVLETLFCTFPKCDYRTEFQHRMDRHMKTHDRESRKHCCKLCSFWFKTRGELEDHVQRHLGEKPYSCPYCERTTTSNGALRVHARKIHSIHVAPCTRENQHLRTCRVCNATFSSYNEFVLHSLSHLQPVVVLQRLNLHVI